MELVQRMSHVWLASAGLLVVLACSSAPPRAKAQAGAKVKDTSGPVSVSETKVDSIPARPFRPSMVSVAPAPTSEVQDMLDRFPKLARYHDGEKIDSIPANLFRLNRVAAAELKEAFPGVRFYRGLSARIPRHAPFGEHPPEPYLMAVTDDTFFLMPFEFNRLLFAAGRRLNNSSIAAMARAYVLLYVIDNAARDTANSSDIPPITILDTKRTRERLVLPCTSEVYVKVKVGEEVQEWYLENWRGQFRSVVMKNPHLEEDRKRPPGLSGTIEVLGYILDPPMPVLEESVH